MLFRITRPTKGAFRNTVFVLSSAILILVIAVFCTNAALAQDAKPDNAVGYYTKDGKVTWIIPGKGIDVTQHAGMTPSVLEKLYPMTPESEAAIVHPVPASQIIIDGTHFEGKQIALFNGKRLRFIEGKDGTLYAFTTPEKLEQFQKEQYGVSKQMPTSSVFYKDAWYTGQVLGLSPGYGLPYLYQIWFDNCISSVEATTTGSWTYLFDYTNYGGDYFGMARGSNYPWLALQGWEDRAESVWVYQ